MTIYAASGAPPPSNGPIPSTDVVVWDASVASSVRDDSNQPVPDAASVCRWTRSSPEGAAFSSDGDWVVADTSLAPTYESSTAALSFAGGHMMYIPGNQSLGLLQRTVYMVLTPAEASGFVLCKAWQFTAHSVITFTYSDGTCFGGVTEPSAVGTGVWRGVGNSLVVGERTVLALSLGSDAGDRVIVGVNGACVDTFYEEAVDPAVERSYDLVLGWAGLANGRAPMSAAEANAEYQAQNYGFEPTSYVCLVHEIRIYPAVHDEVTIGNTTRDLQAKWSAG